VLRLGLSRSSVLYDVVQAVVERIDDGVRALKSVFEGAGLTNFLAIVGDEHLVSNAKLVSLAIRFVKVPFLTLLSLVNVDPDIRADGVT